MNLVIPPRWIILATVPRASVAMSRPPRCRATIFGTSPHDRNSFCTARHPQPPRPRGPVRQRHEGRCLDPPAPASRAHRGEREVRGGSTPHRALKDMEYFSRQRHRAAVSSQRRTRTHRNLPNYNGRHVLGASNPVFVDSSRKEWIKHLLTRGELEPSTG